MNPKCGMCSNIILSSGWKASELPIVNRSHFVYDEKAQLFYYENVNMDHPEKSGTIQQAFSYCPFCGKRLEKII